MRVGEWSLLATLSILWGGSFFFAELALRELPPLLVVLGRVGFAALALNLLLPLVGQALPRDWRTWRALLLMSALNNLVPFSLIFWGQTTIASGLAAILNATTPLFGVLLAHLLTRDERLSAGRLAGLLLGIVGVAVMIGADALGGLDRGALAELAVLGAAFSYALAGIFGRRFAGLPAMVTATGQVTASTLLLLPVALTLARPWHLAMPAVMTWASLLALALVCTALAYILYFRILATAGATNLLLVTFLIPVSALVLGIAFLGERLDPRQLAGMALIGLGLAAIDGRPLARLRRVCARRHAAPARRSG